MAFFKKKKAKTIRRVHANVNPARSRSLGKRRIRLVDDDDLGGVSLKGFNAAKLDRLSLDWLGTKENINREIRNDKERVDGRTYDAQKNNPYVAAYLRRYLTNVFGHNGIRFQALARFPDGEFDDLANDVIERKFKQWCNPEYCTMNGRLTFRRVQWVVGTQKVLSGEFLIRVVTNVKKQQNPFGISLQVLNPKNIDTQFNEDYKNSFVINGVHVDNWGKIVGVWMKTPMYPFGTAIGNERYFIPANEIIYDYDVVEINQLRGMSSLASVLVTLKGVERWDDASLINAAAGASTMAFLYKEKMDADKFLGSSRNVNLSEEEQKKVQQEQQYGGKYMDLAPGVMQKIPYGWKVDTLDPKFPAEQHAPFNRTMLRKVAAAIGTNYNLAAGDLENVNFSSIRQGSIDERDNWKMEQSFIIDSFLIPFANKWIDWCLLFGALKPLDNYSLIDKYLQHNWIPRSYEWVRPKEEAESKEINVRNRFKSLIQVVNEDGGDIEKILKEEKRVKDLLKKYDLNEPEPSGSRNNGNGKSHTQDFKDELENIIQDYLEDN